MTVKTNAQRVQQLASQLGGRINDRQFFLNIMTKRYFENAVMSLTKRYSTDTRVPVEIVWEDPEMTAYTDHRKIVANAHCSLLKGLKRPERFLALHGFIWHETAHILYTDNVFRAGCIKKMKEEHVLYPEPDVPCDGLKQILAEGKHTNAFISIWNSLRNGLEDGFIEYTFLEDYPAPRFKNGLEFMRKIFRKSFKTLPEMIADEKSGEEKLFTILSIMLGYAKFGILPYKNRREQKDERVQAVVKAIPFIDAVNVFGESEEHYRAINNVFAVFEPYLVAYLSSLPEEKENDGIPESLKELTRSLAGQTGIPDSDCGCEPGSDDSRLPLASAGNRKPDKAGQGTGSGNCEGGPEPEISMEETEKEMKRLLNGISEEKAKQQLEKETAEKLSEENRTFGYGSIHNGVTCDIIRSVEVKDGTKEAYTHIRPDVDRLVTATVKGLKQVLKDKRSGSVMRGLYFGKNISPVSYVRYDRKYFENRKLPTDSPTLSIAVVIDESGSMNGRKIESAKLMALVVYRFCMELGIRLMIAGHTASGGHVEITNYCDFGGSYDNNDIYRIMGICSKHCNRDGYANRYAVEKLSREQADMKLCIIISDGAPNDRGYGGQQAFDDIKKVRQDAKNHHIDTVVAAIDDDKEDIKKIYGEESFLDITDLDKLPKSIITMIKKYMKTV